MLEPLHEGLVRRRARVGVLRRVHVAVDHARGEELRLGQLDDVLGPVLRQHGLDLVRVLGHGDNSAVLDDDQPVLDELDEARAPRVCVDEAAADRELRRVRRERGQLFFERGHQRLGWRCLKLGQLLGTGGTARRGCSGSGRALAVLSTTPRVLITGGERDELRPAFCNTAQSSISLACLSPTHHVLSATYRSNHESEGLIAGPIRNEKPVLRQAS